MSTFNIDIWLETLLEKIKNTYGKRLLFAGHIGSWARGEAGPASDIDVNVILSSIEPNDITKYREIIKSMPYAEKACGFIADKTEMDAWPKQDLFHFIQGCHVLFGNMDAVVNFPQPQYILDYIKNSTAALLHGARHRLIYSPDLSQEIPLIKDAYKSIFFILQSWLFVQKGNFYQKKSELIENLSDALDKEVFNVNYNWSKMEDEIAKNPEKYLVLLADWSKQMLLLANQAEKDII